MYKIKKLSNGLTVLKVPTKGAKSVLVDIFVKVGSRSEDKKINGISHFLEHLFFKGSQKFPTAYDLSHALDQIGAHYNANTGKEHTQYYIKAAKKHFAFIFETLSDVIQNPIFAEEEIEREKGVIVEEINMYEDTPIRHVDDILEEMMWPGHPLGRNIAGTKQIIRSVKRSDIAKYKETFYQPENLILAVSGAFDEKELDRLVNKYWLGLKNEKVPKWQKVRWSQKNPVLKVQNKQTEQYHMTFGFHGYDYNHKMVVPVALLSVILGGGMSSRLFTEVRERRGLAYYVNAGDSNYQDTGTFVVKAGVRLEALSEAVETIVRELNKIKNDPVPDAELEKAKEYLKGTLTLALEDSESRLGWYLEQTAFRKQIIEPEDFYRKIDDLEASDVKKVATDLFQNEKANLAVIGPNGIYTKNLKKLIKF